MPTMPPHKDSIHFSHQNAHLVDQIYPIHHLEEENALIALQTSSAGGFFPGAKDMGSTRRRNPTQFNEAFACDDFRMYDYKVRRCMRGRSHDWTDCPFAHPGEKARRRDPRKIHYSGMPCPDFRKGSCQRGDACEFAHGVFECWLHPARYRTQPCKDGKSCTRRVCFFAHSMQQLRHVGVPAEESLAERATVDSHAHGLYSHTQDLGSTMHMSYEHEVGLPSQANSSEDRVSAVDLPTNSPCGADSMVGLSAQDVYPNVGSLSEMLSMLTLSSENVSSSPFEAVSTVGFSSSINTMGVPLEVHSPSPNFPSVAPGPSVASSGMGAISQNDSFIVERSSAPEIFSSASSLQLYTPVVGALSSSNSHTIRQNSSYMGGSPSQQAAAWQNFLMHEGFRRGGESMFSVSADEVSDMVYHRGYGDMEMQYGYLNALGRGRPDVNEVANELNEAAKSVGLTDQLALLRKEIYEFSSYNSYSSYGLSSPTSTLAGPLYPSPFSSPPLSPLSTPSSETSNVFSSRCHGNVQVDDAGHKAHVHIQNSRCMKELEFKHTFPSLQSLHSQYHSQLLGHEKVNTALRPCLKSPLFSQCTSGKNKWVPPRNNWNSEDTYKCGVSQLMFDDMQNKMCDRYGGESPAENVIPDLGWVHELIM